MTGLVIGHTDPVVEEGARQVRTGEPHDDIPGEIDRIEFDMGQRMQQCDAPRCAAIDLAAWDRRWFQQGRMRGPTGTFGRRCRADLIDMTIAPKRSNVPGLSALFVSIIGQENLSGRLRERIEIRAQSALAASSTSSTWPGTLTLRQTLRTLPLASIRNVARSIPMNFLPYMDFSTQTP